MKRVSKFITIPCSLYDTPDLSVNGKWVLMALDSVCIQGGWISVGVQALSTLTNLSSKEVKAALLELREHGAIEVKVNEDNVTLMKPLLYKESYPKVGEKIVVGDKPTDADPIDYGAIQEAWNEHCHMLPKLERMTPARKSRLRSVLKQSDLSVEDLIKCFKIIACTPFLCGQTDKFRAGFDWLTANSKNATKVWEGFYSRTYQEKRDHELIRNGGEVNQQTQSDDYYR